jgi:succinate dehydrogenase cytochrome b subunit
MSRRLDMVLSSIGKKELMALTGIGFVGFLVVHLAGNFTMLAGGEAFNAYAAKLESLGPLVLVAEGGMLLMAMLHVVFGFALILRNLQARGTRYASKKGEGGRTLGSWTMWLTGPWILVFIGLHLAHFTIEHKLMGNEAPLSQLVAERLADPIWAGYYILSVFVVGLHVSHGFWSAFQTLGAAPERKGHLRDAAILLGFVFGAGYGLLAFFVFYIRDLLT